MVRLGLPGLPKSLGPSRLQILREDAETQSSMFDRSLARSSHESSPIVGGSGGAKRPRRTVSRKAKEGPTRRRILISWLQLILTSPSCWGAQCQRLLGVGIEQGLEVLEWIFWDKSTNTLIARMSPLAIFRGWTIRLGAYWPPTEDGVLQFFRSQLGRAGATQFSRLLVSLAELGYWDTLGNQTQIY